MKSITKLIQLILCLKTLTHILGQSVSWSALVALTLQILILTIFDMICYFDTISHMIWKVAIQAHCTSIWVNRVYDLTLEQTGLDTTRLIWGQLIINITGLTNCQRLVFLTILYRWQIALIFQQKVIVLTNLTRSLGSIDSTIYDF